jgi:16S rRNA (uracil1498-N3)-methyltransferase
MAEVRLYIDHPLGAGQAVPLSADQAHYLGNVMRLGPGAAVTVFNGREGAWRARVATLGKGAGVLEAEARAAPQRMPPDLWLLFAPLKKARTDFIVEKATELGAARILPVQTDHTNADRIARARLQAHAVEAAEQCGGTYVPPVAPLERLAAVLDRWPEERRLIWADEAAAGPATALAGTPPGPLAVLIGPEGGFSDAERRRLADLPQTLRISLGPRILRADTAAVAALTLVQAAAGDWR